MKKYLEEGGGEVRYFMLSLIVTETYGTVLEQTAPMCSLGGFNIILFLEVHPEPNGE